MQKWIKLYSIIKYFKTQCKNKIYNITNKIINNIININFFINFYLVESLFNVTKIISKRYNDFFHMNSLLIKIKFLIFKSKIDKLRQKIAIFFIIN